MSGLVLRPRSRRGAARAARAARAGGAAATACLAWGIAHAATVNGTVAPGEYTTALATQTTPTGFGDNFSELNQALANYTPGGNLELALTGNLEPIGNAFVLFIDSRAGGGIASTAAGGFNQLGSIPGQRADDWGTDTDLGAGVTPTPGGASVLPPGFNPDYALEIHNTGGASYFINVIDLTLPNAPANNRDVALGSAPLNSGAAVTQTYTRLDANGNPIDSGDVTSSFDNRNAAGVTDADASAAATATRGLELILESQFLAATPGHALRVLPFITSADGATLSNQFLPGLGAGVDNLGPANDPAGTPLFDARSFSDRFYLEVFVPTITTGGDWLAGASWTGGAAPNGAEQSARVAGSGAQNLTFSSGVTLGHLELANAAGAALGGDGGTLNFNAGSGAAALFVTAGGHSINAVVNVQSDWRVNVAQDASVGIAGLSVAANKRITKAGGGTLTLVGAQMLNGPGVTFDVQRGTLDANANLGTGLALPAAPALTVGVAGGGSPAVVNFGSTQTLGTLTVRADGAVNLLPDRTRVLVADAITLSGNAKVDIGDNKLITNTPKGAATTPSGNGRLYDGIQGMVQRAKNGDAWNGPGMTSSVAAAEAGRTTIGVATAAEARGIGLTETTVWAGQTVTGSTVLAMYTYAGDANLDGAITGDDYSAIDFAILFAGSDGYANGDFNYDGVITGDDYSVIDLNFLLQGPPIPAGETSRQFTSVSAVPEPAACLVAPALAAALKTRRRRRRRRGVESDAPAIFPNCRPAAPPG